MTLRLCRARRVREIGRQGSPSLTNKAPGEHKSDLENGKEGRAQEKSRDGSIRENMFYYSSKKSRRRRGKVVDISKMGKFLS